MKITIREILEAVKGTLLYGSPETVVTSVETNSNEVKPGALFVPIKGERVDGHQYIDSAFGQGAAASFLCSEKKIGCFLEGKAYIQVEDTIAALQALGSWYRDKFPIPVVGITGSVGKTTAKEMIGAALATRYNVLKTIGNRNSQVGLPLMMFCFQKETQVAVIEMGMSEPGEMERLSAVAKPDMMVITNIGVAHINQLGTKENIRKEKLSSLNCFGGSRKKRKLFLNGGDPLLEEVAVRMGYKAASALEQFPISLYEETREALEEADCVVFGLKEGAPFYGKDIQVKRNGTTCFTFVYPEGEEDIVLSVLGRHNVENALAALAVAYEFGIAPSVAKEGLLRYEAMAMRGRAHQKDGITIVDDSYNASPDSMKGAIEVLLQIEGLERRIAVFGDIFELGEVSYSSHYEVGQFIAEASYKGREVHEVVTVGQEAEAIAKGVLEKGKAISVHSFADKREALSYLRANLKKGDGVVVKGSRGMEMEIIVNELLEH